MYNLLILDDEFMVVNGLAYDIEWADIGVSEVFKAYDVQHAMEYLNKHRIDVAITDIRMPDMDGLNFTDIIREKWPYTKVILVSGYYEFEYAQTAIDLGVFSYVSKPVRNEEIKNVVKRALEAIEKDLEKVRILENVQNQLKEVLPILQERNLNAWVVHGRLTPDRDAEVLRQSNIRIDCSDKAFLILVRIGLWNEEAARSSNGLFEISLHTAIKKVLFKGNETYLLFNDPEGNQIGLVYDKHASVLEKICEYVSAMAETFQVSVERSHERPVSVLWGNIVDVRDLHEDYKRILKRMRQLQVWNSGVIMGPETQEADLDGERLKKLYAYPPFSLFIESRQKDRAVAWIDEVFAEAKNIPDISFANLLRIFYAIFSALTNDSVKAGIPSGDWDGKMQAYLSDLSGISDIDELQAFCTGITTVYLEHMQEIEMNKTTRLVKKIMAIIEERLHEDISVTEIASCMHLHPNYLSRLFKSETGSAVIDYLIQRRLDKAKSLLRTPGSKVYEIAALVGYDSVPHFSRIFKRETGMSPKEYQQHFCS